MNTTDSRHGARRWWVFYAIAAATFLPALGFHYVGEEAIFAISSLEMWYGGEWLQQIFLGGNLQHNPLFNWLIIPFASLAGWEHVLAVARAVTIGATAATGLALAWLVKALYRDTAFAAFAAVVYLTLADVFFYRGWLAYVDPLFGFFVAAAIACLWVACLRHSLVLLALAVAALTCAFMSKAYTAYVFYGVAAVVLCCDRQNRAFLLGPGAWALHVLAAAAPAAWLGLVPANVGQSERMFVEILAKLAPESLAEYASKVVAYPLETALKLMPALAAAAYYFWKQRGAARGRLATPERTALIIALVNYLPYWLAPHSHTRYLTPLYPFFALVVARVIWLAGAHAVRVTQHGIVVVIALKLVVMLIAFPYYQRHYRGENYAVAARDIQTRAAGQPLYTTNVSASGLSVVAHLDIVRLPQPPLTFPPARWDSGFVISYQPDPGVGPIAARYRLGGNDLYLLCRGAACDAGSGK